VEKEPVVLSRYSGGFIPDPTAPKKIESLDWPAPIAIQAVPELMKTRRSRSESRSNPSEIIDNQDQQIPNENELRHDEKLDKDINEMSKIKDSSGMAHALLEDLRIQEKIISKQLPLDPWKASRSPSAAIEPPRRCRFDSPKFASPSRRVHTHSSSTTNQDDSFAAFPTSIATTPVGRKPITLPSYQHPQNDTLVLRPDDNLSPLPNAQILPNRLDIQRSCDLDSTTNSCCKK
jgi:actin-binding LIM protein